ncbi:autotransporter outer membrane beta-barrel domain-containing protein [Acuticoccus kandeliae]|uniref:autotransporter outer membrane beta-barrel domain-containing protein n=1 Tax=Acuticoccus kandeliae TaxID=2073160 RepID=UPI000D3EB278|nr:autotransporter outer membrane beta-barrel domain-containing protein [Acuticoccus kandeliae]
MGDQATHRHRLRKAKIVTSTLLLQSTALVGSLVGIPGALYSRAYAQAKCSPSVSAYVLDAGGKRQASDTTIPQQTFTCTITSDATVTTPQYVYGGPYMFYENPPTTQVFVGRDSEGYDVYRGYVGAASPQPGLNIAVDNQAEIHVSTAATTGSILAPGTSTGSLPLAATSQAHGIGVVSRGSRNFYRKYVSGPSGTIPGNGGNAGAITITNTADVTSEVGAGIYALSRGGDGLYAYAGGHAGAVSITTSGTVRGARAGVVGISQGGVATGSAGVGGDETKAGSGGAVTVTVYAPVYATQSGPAVLAASYGGNRTRAKSSLREFKDLARSQTMEAGAGGDAGTTTLRVGSSESAFSGTISTVSSGIVTTGSPARASGAAIAATSIGGDGIPVLKDLEYETYYSGGDAGTVTLTVNATSDARFATKGDDSTAVIAQSAGGRSRTARYYSRGNTYVGGDGADTKVTLTGGGTIDTAGAYSSGLVAQSLGGAGQSTFAGTYGKAGKAATVTVTNDFSITTQGDRSHGIVAQSAAAAFGYGIYNFDGTDKIVWGDANTSSTGSDDVTVTNHGAIIVYGVDSHGIVAQSIGGGGGILTSTAPLAAYGSSGFDANGQQQVGGASKKAGGATVNVYNYANVATYGGYSKDAASRDPADAVKLGGGIAILAQSIGGGGGINTGEGASGRIGGAGGSSAGGDVTVLNTAILTTTGSEAHGIVAQSIGGGGGVGRNRSAAFMAVGGSGGPGAVGGSVEVDHEGEIHVSGDFAAGIVVQSIGGGGGIGGKASSIGLVFDDAIGGSGGAGGGGGDAAVKTGSDSEIRTSGLNAVGLHVQSIGGGGGSGGAASSTAFNVPFPFSFSIATGGSGGNGGDGSLASAIHNGELGTSGTDSTGILVQSIGGGGGTGGGSSADALALSIPYDEELDAFNLTFSFSHGGTGGTAGHGGEAVARLCKGAIVKTTGDGALGVHVQSIGGGGGAGGDSTAASTTFSFGEAVEDFKNLVLPKGPPKSGSGGDDPGDDDKDKDPSNISLNLDVALGGDGGGGGNGAYAHAQIRGDVSTGGAFATGVLVQSIGGGGGHAGSGESQAKSDGSNSFTLGVSIGGTGGVGGAGGKAVSGVFAGASIVTTGTGSRGLVIQSVGGGGGMSGGGGGDVDATTALSIGLGRTGGAGGDGGAAFGWNDGTISTSGDFSDGLVVQSIGGGGGVGGSGTSSVSHEFEFKRKFPKDGDDNSVIDDPANRSMSMGVSLGMTAASGGGIGGNGGAVVVGQAPNKNKFTSGTTTTYGAFSHGILAQSIGGGGGVAGSSSNQGAEEDDNGVPDLSKLSVSFGTIKVGASNGGGGAGGSVTVYANTVTTHGYASLGVVAQSIGGGGGFGVSSGFALKSIDVTLGSSSTGPSASLAGTVTVMTAADQAITTYGDAAHGIVAQSIGGGGGIAASALGTTTRVNDDSIADVITVTLGSSAPAGSGLLDGGDVSITHAGTISTSGLRAAGIIAQSIGGGGGLMISSDASFKRVSDQSIPVDVVDDQSAASSGDVTIDLVDGASIVTSGDGGVGIIAQAIAGGGGLAGDLNQRIVAGYTDVIYESYNDTATRHGVQGNITVSVAEGASITTSGDHAHGILAQSVGGTGRIGKAATTSSYLVATSSRRNAIYAPPSTGIEVTVDGSVTVGADTAWGVWAHVQKTSINVTVGEKGVLSGSTSSAYAGGAIYTATDAIGTVTITNHGTIIGNIGASRAGVRGNDTNGGTASAAAGHRGRPVLSSEPGTSVLRNEGTGTVVTGAVVGLSSVLNAGTIDVGGTGNTVRTIFAGDLVGVGTADLGSAFDVGDLAMARAFTPLSHHSERGVRNWRTETASRGGLITGLDIDMRAGTNDRLVVRGDFAGTWGVDINPTSLLPNVRADIIKVGGADTSSVTILSSLIFSFAEPAASRARWKGVEIDTARFDGGVDLGRSAAEVARGLQGAWEGLERGAVSAVAFAREEIAIGEVFAAFHSATPETLEDMLRPLASQITLAPSAAAPQKAIATANGVLSCPAFSTGVMLEEGECVWGGFLGSYADQGARSGGVDYDVSTTGFEAGGQTMLTDGWYLGGSLGYEASWYRNGTGNESLDTQAVSGAAALKREAGPWLFALAAGGGYTWGDSKRHVRLGTLSDIAEAEPKSAFAFGRAHVSYEVPLDERFYIRPMLDLDLIAVHQEGYRESGAGALNLIVDDASSMIFAITPGLEVGARSDVTEGLPLRAYAGFGVSFLSEDEWASEARFGGISDMDEFTTTMPISDTVARISAGLDLQQVEGLELKLQYDGVFADRYQSHGGSLRLGYRF